MKELFISFSIAFFASLCCCIFFITGSAAIAIVPGVIVMAVMTVLRVSNVAKNAGNIWSNITALFLGNVLLYGSVYFATFPESKGSTWPLVCWAATIIVAGTYMALRKKANGATA